MTRTSVAPDRFDGLVADAKFRMITAEEYLDVFDELTFGQPNRPRNPKRICKREIIHVRIPGRIWRALVKAVESPEKWKNVE